MIARTQNARGRLLVSLRQGVIVCAAVYLMVSGGLAVEIVLKNSQASGLEHEVLVARQQVRNTSSEIMRANALKDLNAPTDLSAVASLQSAVDKAAGAHGCTVTEFRASSEVSPYLTRFAKTTSVGGWGQVETQLSLSGSPQSVTATLADIATQNIPFEFDSLEISRDQVDDAGDATVVAHATLRVLIRTAKEGE